VKVILVDDEEPARDELRYLLSQVGGMEIVAEFGSAETFLPACRKFAPEVIFLDIQMRGINGIETARMVRKILPEALIVFATAYDEYALEAFEIHAVGYILKPFDEEKLRETIDFIKGLRHEEWQEQLSHVDAALQGLPVQPLKKLALEGKGSLHLVDYGQISYIHIDNGQVRVFLQDAIYNYHGSLTDLEERLHGSKLYRVHRSFIVNLEYVKEVLPWFKGTYWLKLPKPGGGMQEIPVSKAKVKNVKIILGLD
jgi:DNA-binding LytR/AlgR family response regulator